LGIFLVSIEIEAAAVDRITGIRAFKGADFLAEIPEAIE
jgi:hypothetical protein